MKKSDLNEDDIVCFLEDISVQYGEEIAKSCKEAIDKIPMDGQINTFVILAQAIEDNPEVKKQMENTLKSSNLRFNS